MLPKKDDDKQPDTTGDMLQESAKKLSDSLQDVETIPDRGMGQIGTRDRLPAEIAAPQENIIAEIKSPTETVFGTADDQVANIAPDPNLKTPKLTVETAKQRTKKARIRNIKDLEADKSEMTKAAEGRIKTIDEINRENIEKQKAARESVTADEGFAQQTDKALGLDTTRFEGVSQMGALAGDEKEDFKPVKRNSLQTFTTSLKTTGDSVLSKIKTPMMMVLDLIQKEPTPVNKHEIEVMVELVVILQQIYTQV